MVRDIIWLTDWYDKKSIDEFIDEFYSDVVFFLFLNAKITLPTVFYDLSNASNIALIFELLDILIIK
jgi:hypothetical protein